MSAATGGQPPSLGRIVHLELGDGVTHAAIITGVDFDEVHVSLTSFPPIVMPIQWASVNYGTGCRQWHWPPFVPSKK